MRFVRALLLALLAFPASAQSIQHVIYFVQENRSFDHYFSNFPGAAGSQTWCDNGSNTHALFHLNATLQYGDCPHFPTDNRAAITAGSGSCSTAPTGWCPSAANGGTLDSFGNCSLSSPSGTYVTNDGAHACLQNGSTGGGVTANANGVNVGYYDGRDIPRYWRLAYNFGLADHFFSDISPSLPGHMEIGGYDSDDAAQAGPGGCDTQYNAWTWDHTCGAGGSTTNGFWGQCTGGTAAGALCKCTTGTSSCSDTPCTGGGTCSYAAPSATTNPVDLTNESAGPSNGGGTYYAIALAGSSSGLTTGQAYVAGRCSTAGAAGDVGHGCVCPVTITQNLASGGQTSTGTFSGNSCVDSSHCGNSANNCLITAQVPNTPGALFPVSTSSSPHDILSLMDSKGVTWAAYTPPAGTSGHEWSIPDMFSGPHFNDSANMRSLANLNADLASCNLPQFTVITPAFLNSEHPPAPIQPGQNFVASAIDALASNVPCWNSSIVFVIWDDAGGNEDHIIPPSSDALHLGPRVPFLCIGWACKNTVTTTQFEFASVVAWLEVQFNLCASPPGCLAGRDATANSISVMINTAQTPLAPAGRQVTGSSGSMGGTGSF